MSNMKPFSFWRIFLLIILGMIIFNMVMFVVTGKLQEHISFSELFSGIFLFFVTTIMMSIAGFIITPAAIGLSIYAIIMESLYATGILENFWIFSLLAAVVGLGIFMGFSMLVAPDKGWDMRMLTSMFVSHGLTTMLVYRGKF